MIPNHKDRSIQSSGVSESASFGISNNDQAHVMSILRDHLYSDKVLAVLREYSSNAWDSHQASGKPDVPITVTLPTQETPVLGIRDFGAGLSRHDVFNVYSQYGASTKRGNDLTVGMLGIGSKSAFAYADSFNITSWNGGVKSIYVAVLDPSDKGAINLLHEEPCPVEETGVLIEISVKPSDIHAFESKAKNLFRFFKPLPNINTELKAVEEETVGISKNTILTNGVIVPEGSKWLAVMGCIPYEIDLYQLIGNAVPGGGVPSYLTSMAGILYFSIGEVSVSANRESLKYSDSTKLLLVERFTALADEWVTQLLNEIKSSSTSDWDRRLRFQVFRKINIPIPATLDTWTKANIHLYKHPLEKCKITYRDGSLVQNLTVHSGVALCLKDDPRAFFGFDVEDGEVFVARLNTKTSWEDVQKELDELLSDLQITGIAIHKLSDKTWTPPTRSKDVVGKNDKHKVTSFVMDPKPEFFHKPRSKHWNIHEHVPAKEDVFVCLRRFKAPKYDFYALVKEDKDLAKVFGVELPPIYGYKDIKAHPVDVTEIGVEYLAWRPEFIKSLMTPAVVQEYELWNWFTTWVVAEKHTYAGLKDQTIADSIIKKRQKDLFDDLGKDHAISQIFDKFSESNSFVKQVLNGIKADHYRQVFGAFKDIESRLVGYVPESKKASDKIKAKYPLLLRNDGDLTLLWEEPQHYLNWIYYIYLIDSYGHLPIKPLTQTPVGAP